MQHTQAQGADDQYRLRFVFDDGAVSFGHGAEITYGEIAQTLDALARKRGNNPIGIDFARVAPRLARGVELLRYARL